MTIITGLDQAVFSEKINVFPYINILSCFPCLAISAFLPKMGHILLFFLNRGFLYKLLSYFSCNSYSIGNLSFELWRTDIYKGWEKWMVHGTLILCGKKSASLLNNVLFSVEGANCVRFSSFWRLSLTADWQLMTADEFFLTTWVLRSIHDWFIFEISLGWVDQKYAK